MPNRMLLPRFNQDIRWGNILTLHGYNTKQLVSVLNKELRRGNTNNALNVAMELLYSGKQHEGKLWQRLVTVAAEDIGLGDTNAYVAIANFYYRLSRPNIARDQLAQQAVIRLCTATKDRSADEVFNYALATTLTHYQNSPYYTPTSTLQIPNTSRKTFFGKPIGQALEEMGEYIHSQSLTAAMRLAVDCCFGGRACERSLWTFIESFAKNESPDWLPFIAAGKPLSLAMKQGKNDRYMALMVAIMGILLHAQPPDYDLPAIAIRIGKPVIPEYALDMHAQTDTSFKPTVDDFRQFWEDGSKLSNQQHIIGDEYRNWILAHLEQFVAIRPIRELMQFVD